MNSIRVKFIRGEEVKFISHLDLMKTFERAIRRSHEPIAYSEGFNPHPQMVFGLPLSVGVTSEAEYADFDFSRPVDPQQFLDSLNRQLPQGLRLLEAKPLNTRDNIMKAISAASYEVYVLAGEGINIENLNSIISKFLDCDSIVVKKESKSGIRDVDIRPMILSLKAGAAAGEILHDPIYTCVDGGVLECVSVPRSEDQYPGNGGLIRLEMLLSAGSSANLKPELLVEALKSKMEIDIGIRKVHRTGLYINKEGEIASPMDDCVLSGV